MHEPCTDCVMPLLLCARSGADPGFTCKRGGAQIHCSEHDNCMRSTQSGMQSMLNLGRSGGMPPRKF